MSVTVILAEMEELAPTPKEVICADARKDGQAMIVGKVKLSICTILVEKPCADVSWLQDNK